MKLLVDGTASVEWERMWCLSGLGSVVRCWVKVTVADGDVDGDGIA